MRFVENDLWSHVDGEVSIAADKRQITLWQYEDNVSER